MKLFNFIRSDVLQTGKKWSILESNWNSDDGYSTDNGISNVPWNMKSTAFWNTVEFIVAQENALNGCSSKQGFTVECIFSVENFINFFFRFNSNVISIIGIRLLI